MNKNPDDYTSEYDHADHIQIKIAVCANHIGIAGKYTAEKSFGASYFLHLVFIERGHQDGVI